MCCTTRPINHMAPKSAARLLLQILSHLLINVTQTSPHTYVNLSLVSVLCSLSISFFFLPFSLSLAFFPSLSLCPALFFAHTHTHTRPEMKAEMYQYKMRAGGLMSKIEYAALGRGRGRDRHNLHNQRQKQYSDKHCLLRPRGLFSFDWSRFLSSVSYFFFSL